MTYKTRMGCVVWLAALFVAIFPLQAQQSGQSSSEWVNAQFVRNGVVDTGNPAVRLAVRSGPGNNFSQVGQLSHGDRVHALETRNGWIRIQGSSPAPAQQAAPQRPAVPRPAPPPVSAAGENERWVNSRFVVNGVVDAGDPTARLAVRTGPGTNYPQTDQLAHGERIQVIETRAGWFRIADVAPVAVPAAPEPTPATPVPARPPVTNLVLNGDFSNTSLALPTASGVSTASLSGRWLRPSFSAWEIAPSGGNLGPFARAMASGAGGRLLYVVNDGKRANGSYVLQFDYLLGPLPDSLGVKVFVSDIDILIGTDAGSFRMNGTQRPSDLIVLPPSASWVTYQVPVDLGQGFEYIYVLFVGSGSGRTGVDNVTLSPRR